MPDARSGHRLDDSFGDHALSRQDWSDVTLRQCPFPGTFTCGASGPVQQHISPLFIPSKATMRRCSPAQCTGQCFGRNAPTTCGAEPRAPLTSRGLSCSNGFCDPWWSCEVKQPFHALHCRSHLHCCWQECASPPLSFPQGLARFVLMTQERASRHQLSLPLIQ